MGKIIGDGAYNSGKFDVKSWSPNGSDIVKLKSAQVLGGTYNSGTEEGQGQR
jgi:hypothetical protein